MTSASRDELCTMLCQRPCFAQVYRPEANFVLEDCAGRSMPHAQNHLRLASRTRAEKILLVTISKGRCPSGAGALRSGICGKNALPGTVLRLRS